MSKDLEHLRQEIDKIDEQIFELLIERLKFVSKVGEHKKSEESKRPILRPGREAKMIQNIFDKAKQQGLSDNVALGFSNIWRSIIASAINHEDELKILISKPNEAQKTTICRDYMGPFTEVKILENDAEILAKLKNNESNISIFEAEENYSNTPWWLKISENEELNIFARLPLINNQNADSYFFAVSNIKPEPTGNDKFIYSIKGDIPASFSGEYDIISTHKDFKLIEANDFLIDFSQNFAGRYLGCYSYLVASSYSPD